MTDVHDKATRSRNMAAIKGQGTKPEIWLRKRLHAAGFRYRLNVRTLPGKPDIVLPKYQAVILIHGCFWHMHHCPAFRLPKTRTDWWEEKLSANHKRDIEKHNQLVNAGWRILTIWECAIKGRYRINEALLLSLVKDWIISGTTSAELKGAE
ncbi:very short patch repair endonuclease [Neptunomonas sp.]|uniref:very short patch repair endonuclease n=1 Tax=Neptunomonas sp. TaxID=1971898 RepID=UPI003568D222